MNKVSLEQELLGITKKQQKNEAFINATMKIIKQRQVKGTFDQALRTTGTTNKESFIMKLKRLPRFALIGLTVIGLVSATGTAYGAYRLWTSPSASVNGSVVKLEDCRQAGDSNIMYVDAKSGKSPEQIAQILKAHCEISNIQQWAIHDLQTQPGDTMFPYTVTAIHGDAVTVAGDKNDIRTLSIGKATTFIADGESIPAGNLKVGDGIAYIAPDGSGRVKAVVKLNLPLDYYRTAYQSLVITENECAGNPGELCRQGGGITGVRVDVSGEMASLRFTDDWEAKMIEGKVLEYTDDNVTLKSSSGATYRVSTPHGLISRFSADLSRNAGLTIMPGDTLNVEYRQPKGADKRVVAGNEFEQMTLVVTGDVKTGSLQKY